MRRIGLVVGRRQSAPAPKLGFVLASPSENPLASTRISVLNMLPYLECAGFDASIVYEPAVATETPDVTGLASRLLRQGFAVVYFQKVGGTSVLSEVRQLSAAGVATVHGVCDRVDAAMGRAVSRTIAVTEHLRQLYPADLHDRIRVVHDGIERPQVAKSRWSDHGGTPSRPLQLVHVTSHRPYDFATTLGQVPRWAHLTIVGPYCEADGFGDRVRNLRDAAGGEHSIGERIAHLRFHLHPRIKRVPWHPSHVYECLLEADVAIIPIERNSADHPSGVPAWQLKSENRLTLKMAAGLPVVATPIPSYRSVARDGQDAFLADSQGDWCRALEALRSPHERQRMGRAARESVLDRYSKESQARSLIGALRSLVD